MSVQCANCGEDLVGAVNRCWRCGAEFVSRPGPRDTPPVRRAPIAGDAPAIEAILVGESSVSATNAPETDLGRWTRRGSPFASSDTSNARRDGVPVTLVSSEPLKANYRFQGNASGGVAGAIFLAVVAFFLSFLFPFGSLFLGAIGIGLAVWSIKNGAPRFSTVALLLCCIAFAISGVASTNALFDAFYGISPWDLFLPPPNA